MSEAKLLVAVIGPMFSGNETNYKDVPVRDVVKYL